MNVYGLLFGGLALAWGAVLAFVDRPAAEHLRSDQPAAEQLRSDRSVVEQLRSDRPKAPAPRASAGHPAHRICVTLLIACAAVTVVGVVTAVIRES
ncbi:hypothetical protein [Symbioplanes lichenis]|uniref:hypothetical protein n=1 Tax=Symbioplanes lichenis TaxID=1629072 RepID=UPI0027389D9D|nr:hypothetical protein [Actinoplanes lichenis]